MLKVTGCSMGCLHATGPLSKCLCPCGGRQHGLAALNGYQPVIAYCTPSAEKKCKSGEEGGECRCACKGVNHGLYSSVDFSNVKITGYGN